MAKSLTINSKNNRIKNTFFIINNLFIFITAAIAVTTTLIIGSHTAHVDNSPFPYWQHIATFTILSNIFLGLVAGICAFTVIYSKLKNITVPHQRAIELWYLTAATAAMITCVTVIFFLAPARVSRGGNYLDPFMETLFFLHFFNPLLAAITFIFTTNKSKIGFRTRLLTTLPIIAYAIPYFTCVMVLKTWPDFYGLTFGGRLYITPIVLVVFIIVSLVISSVLVKLRNVLQNKLSVIS